MILSRVLLDAQIVHNLGKSGATTGEVGLQVKGTGMDRLTVLAMFSWQYLLMAFLACLGIVQLAAARSGRRHLWLLPHRRATAFLGVVLLVAGIAMFYLMPLAMAGPWGPTDPTDGSPTWAAAGPDTLHRARNLNDTEGGLSGHWQALWFALAWIGATLLARAAGRRRQTGHQPGTAPPERRILVGTRLGDDR